MRAPAENLSESLVRETLVFARQAMRGSAGLFYWVEPGQPMSVAHTSDMPDGLLDQYFAGMNAFDPFEVRRMAASGRRVGVLTDAQPVWPAEDMARYRRFLGAYDVTETIDLLMWDVRGAFAGIGILKLRDDPPLSACDIDHAALQRFLETSLRTHAKVRSHRIDALLEESFRLTRREREVATLLCTGASNAQIAEMMGIQLPTVKTYVINILDKLGVASRTALIAYLMQLALC